MKEKDKNVYNILIMTFTNLKKYSVCVFRKVLKTTTSAPHPSLQQSQRYFHAKKVTWLRLLFAIECVYSVDRVTKRSVYRSP